MSAELNTADRAESVYTRHFTHPNAEQPRGDQQQRRQRRANEGDTHIGCLLFDNEGDTHIQQGQRRGHPHWVLTVQRNAFV